MEERDLPGVMGLERSCFPDNPWSLGAYLSELGNPLSHGFVAEDEGGVAGYVVANHVLGEGHILKLGVHTARRRGGLARLLSAAALQWLRDNACTRVQLEVRASNEKARELYESMGFRAAGRRKQYYASAGEDALIMEKEL
jgi:ribosomal-protein-alanine N-acetyltransferase